MQTFLVCILGLILLLSGCNDKKDQISLNEIKSFKENAVVFVPDTFEYDRIPFPKIDSVLFNKYFSSIFELKDYTEHTSAVFVYSKNDLPYEMKGITLMVQDDMFMKQYYLLVMNKENNIINRYLVAYSSIDEEWYDITSTTITNDSIFKTNKVSCEILSQTNVENYCSCDSSVIIMIMKPSGQLVKNQEYKYNYKRRYN